MATAIESGSERRATSQWGILDDHPDACGIVTPRMELLYLNAAARRLAPSQWLGRRCWQAFAAGAGCTAGCPVFRAVTSASSAASFCEETICLPGAGGPIRLGLAAVPAPPGMADGAALLVMRPIPAGESVEALRVPLLAEAERLRALL